MIVQRSPFSHQPDHHGTPVQHTLSGSILISHFAHLHDLLSCYHYPTSLLYVPHRRPTLYPTPSFCIANPSFFDRAERKSKMT